MFFATYRPAYAAERSTFEGSLPEKAPPPWGHAPPYVSTMILRPVRPQSPCGPPTTKRPVGFTRYFGFFIISRGSTGLMMFSTTATMNSFFIFGPSDISGECCEEITTVSISAGLPSTYLNVTWLLASGRRYG